MVWMTIVMESQMIIVDSDNDGMSEEGGDCDDENPDIYSGAVEIIDGLDNDRDGEIDENTEISDDDGMDTQKLLVIAMMERQPFTQMRKRHQMEEITIAMESSIMG